MNSSNPALSQRVFTSVSTTGVPMTLQGAVNKTILLVMFVCLSGYYSWQKAAENPDSAGPWMWGGLIVGLILAFVTVFKPQWSAVTGSLYALAEGLVLGAVSAIYEARFHGIVLQAVMLTIGVLFAMLALYTLRIIQPTAKFQMGVFAATGGIVLVYLFTWILGLFHVHMFDSLYGNGLLGIGFSIFIVIIAALNLIIDFGVIEYGVANRAPKFMEWYSAFGILVTLVWLYLQILRLLAQLSGSRRD